MEDGPSDPEGVVDTSDTAQETVLNVVGFFMGTTGGAVDVEVTGQAVDITMHSDDGQPDEASGSGPQTSG